MQHRQRLRDIRSARYKRYPELLQLTEIFLGHSIALIVGLPSSKLLRNHRIESVREDNDVTDRRDHENRTSDGQKESPEADLRRTFSNQLPVEQTRNEVERHRRDEDRNIDLQHHKKRCQYFFEIAMLRLRPSPHIPD